MTEAQKKAQNYMNRIEDGESVESIISEVSDENVRLRHSLFSSEYHISAAIGELKSIKKWAE